MPDYKAAMIATGAKNMNTASTDAARMLQNATLKDALAEVFEDLGLTPKHIAQTLMDGMKANKTASFKGDVYESDVPDHGVRVSSLNTALKVMGLTDGDKGGNTINLNFNGNQATKSAYVDGEG